MDIKELQTDQDLEMEGTWVDLLEGDDGVVLEVKVKRMFNPDFQAYLAKKTRLAGRTKARDPKFTERLTTEGVVETVLLDWRGLTEGDGKVVKFSKTRALELLKQSRDFRNMVIAAAEDAANFYAAEQEADRKN